MRNVKEYTPKKLCHHCDKDETNSGELYIIEGEQLCYQCARIKIEEMWEELSFEDKCDILSIRKEIT